MATTVPIRLEGGPCDGRNATVERTGDLLPGYTCKGANYQPTSRVGPGGRVIYTTKASQTPPPAPDDGNDARPAKAHSAWHHMTRTVFVKAPRELQRSAQARHALRLLRHRKGLR